jgi:hypothetical protein
MRYTWEFFVYFPIKYIFAEGLMPAYNTPNPFLRLYFIIIARERERESMCVCVCVYLRACQRASIIKMLN